MPLRIISGALGGRHLHTPRGERTRPTSDRVRQGLFDVLGSVAGCRVLDVYAGTGALGIEALSRGAERAVFVEAARPALTCIVRNLEELELADRARVIRGRVERAGLALEGEMPFDLVFLDPPWPALERALEAMPQWLGPIVLGEGARVVVEHPAKIALAPRPHGMALALTETRVWGDTATSIYAPLPKPLP